MTLDEKIADAETQYHLLSTGQAARVFVDQNGERVEFVAANASRLQAYIAKLKAEKAGIPSKPVGPLQVLM